MADEEKREYATMHIASNCSELIIITFLICFQPALSSHIRFGLREIIIELRFYLLPRSLQQVKQQAETQQRQVAASGLPSATVQTHIASTQAQIVNSLESRKHLRAGMC